MTDRSVVEQAQCGDRAAFGVLASELSDRLYPVAHRILRDADAAGDAVQSALVEVWKYLPTLRDIDRLDAWAHRIVVNRCHSQLRSRRHRPGTVGLLEGDAVPATGVEGSVELRDELERAFLRLTADQRAVLVLTYFRDLPVDEVAAILEVSTGTVKSRLFGARQAMRAALEADARTVAQEGQA